MKPAPFDYCAPRSIDEALARLAASPGAKLLAGGQSLIPMLNFRLLATDLLIDLTRIPELRGILPHGRSVRIGALATHHEVETSALIRDRFPVMSDVMRHVAHLAIRNRGTAGGSLVHADPAAEWPLLAVLLNARFHAAGPNGERTIDAQDFLVGALTSSLGPDEILLRIDFPALPRDTAWAFDEVALRAGDFALCAAAVTLSTGGSLLTGGRRITDARIALAGVADTAIRIPVAERMIRGQRRMTPEIVRQVASCVRDAITPNSDLHASADYRRHLCHALVERLLGEASRSCAAFASGDGGDCH
ncbi:MAG: FAD binding domain-containing protein [Gammaproteobacteria bacterium]|nr:FAD binding domain-containing protein [Gammaproteobacteria bacterium]MDE0271658.1 FAD binding domain-containing protein [Gammaproteobacteria bacterium]